MLWQLHVCKIVCCMQSRKSLLQWQVRRQVAAFLCSLLSLPLLQAHTHAHNLHSAGCNLRQCPSVKYFIGFLLSFQQLLVCACVCVWQQLPHATAAVNILAILQHVACNAAGCVRNLPNSLIRSKANKASVKTKRKKQKQQLAQVNKNKISATAGDLRQVIAR